MSDMVEMPDPADDWRPWAACLGADPNLFFPKRGESTKAARAICGTCIVSMECLEDAIERNEPAGIRGGLSTHARQEIVKKLKRMEADGAT